MTSTANYPDTQYQRPGTNRSDSELGIYKPRIVCAKCGWQPHHVVSGSGNQMYACTSCETVRRYG